MVTVVINNSPPEISLDPFNISVTITGAKAGTNYLRIEVYKDGTTNYFGETFNGKDWYSGTDGTKYFPIEIRSSSSSATFQGKITDPINGNYKLKIKRYTASGSSSSTDQESPVDIKINYSKETPTPVPTTTSDPTDTPLILAELSPSPTTTNEPIVLAESTQSSTSISTSPTKKPNEIITQKKNSNSPVLSILVIILGFFLIGFAVWYNLTNVPKNKKTD